MRSSVLARLASLHMQRERWDEARTPLRDALRSALKVGEARLVAEVSLAALTMAAHDGDLDAWDGQASVAMAYFARSDVADAPAAEALEAAASLIAARSPARAASALELAASKWDALGDAERAARTRASAENVLAAVASHH